MAFAPGTEPIPGIPDAASLENAVSKGVLKDPKTIEMARAAYGSPVIVNPLLAPPPSAVPPPAPANPLLAALGPKPEPAPKPSPLLPNVPVVEDLHNDPGGASLAEKAMHAKAAGVPMAKPAPKPVAHGGGPAGPATTLASPAPVDPAGVGNFGKTPTQIKAEQQEQIHGINQLNYQNQLSDTDIAGANAFDAIAQKAAAEADAKMRATEMAVAKRKAFLDAYNADTMRAVEEYSKAEIDPNKYWHDKGTGGSILAAVGIALGGWASGLAAKAGREMSNTGVELIERGIQRDIEAQKANIAKKGAGIEARKGLYGMYLQQFGSEDAAEAMAYETYLRKTKADIDAQAAKTTNEQVKIRAAALSESLEDRIKQAANGHMIAGEKMYDAYQAKKQAQAAAAANELKKRNQQIADANLKAMTERITKNGGVVLPAQTDIPLASGGVIPAGTPVAYNGKGEIDMGGTEALAKVTTVNMPVLQPGGSVAYSPVAVQKEGYGKASEKVAGATNAIKAIEQMEAADKMPGPWVGEKKMLFDQAQKNYATAYGVANGMGALSGEDLKIVYGTIPGVPTWGVGFMTDAERATLANQKKTLAGQAQAAATVYGTPETAGPAPLSSVGKPQ